MRVREKRKGPEMKTGRVIRSLLVLFSGHFLTAAEPSVLQVAERGFHHKVWNKTHPELQRDGTVLVRTNSYVELATGLCHWDDTERAWKDSVADIQLLPAGGAAATKGQHRVFFPANSAAQPISILMSDGLEFESRVTALAFFDAASGNSVLIAANRGAAGKLVAPNQVLYPDTFDDIKADILCTYSIAGMEVDVIIRAQLPSPADWNLDPATVRLQVWHEVTSDVQPAKVRAFI
jgi:hypothetical protein